MSVSAPVPLARDDEGWTRVHPASPWVKGWTAIAVFLVVVARDSVERLVAGLLGQGGDDGAAGPVDAAEIWVPAAILGGAFVVFGLLFFASWWFTRFRVGPEQIELRQGWLFRSRRQMKYDRVQAVDLQFPLVARLLGLASVKVEAADGGESALELSFLRKAQAAQVRREILGRASGAIVGPASAPRAAQDAAAGLPAAVVGVGEAAVDAPEAISPATPASHPGAASRVRALLEEPQDEGTVMLRVPPGRLIGSVLLSDAVVVTIVGFVLFAGITSLVLRLLPGEVSEGEDVGFTAILLGMAVPIVFSLIGGVWSGLNSGWGFTVRDSADGLRLRYGLTETNAQTVPPGRVQGVEVIQPLMWRPFGWHRVKVAVAGYGGGDAGSRDVALPVGPWEDVLRVLAVVAPDPGLDDARNAGASRAAQGPTPAEFMRIALVGSGTDGGFRHVPRRARWWFNQLAWRRHGYALTRTLLVVRHGRLRRRFQTLQHERLQEVALSQGPVQRRLRVASLTVQLAGGSAEIVDLDEAELRELFDLESAHAARSRRLADRNRWMAPEELERFERRTAEVAETEVGRRELAHAGVETGAVEMSAGGTSALQTSGLETSREERP